MTPTTARDRGEWFKSRRSGNNGTDCVEARYPVDGDDILVRDSKMRDEPGGPELVTFSRGAWGAFISDL